MNVAKLPELLGATMDATYEPVNELPDRQKAEVIKRDYASLRHDLEGLGRPELLLIKANVCRLLEPLLVRDGFNQSVIAVTLIVIALQLNVLGKMVGEMGNVLTNAPTFGKLAQIRELAGEKERKAALAKIVMQVPLVSDFK